MVGRVVPQDPVSDDDPDMDIKKVYKVMYSIIKLKRKVPWILYLSSKSSSDLEISF